MQSFGILFTNMKNGRRFLMVESKESPTSYKVYIEHAQITGEFCLEISMGEKDYLKSFKDGAAWAGGERVSDFELKSGLAVLRVDPISKLEYFVLLYNGVKFRE